MAVLVTTPQLKLENGESTAFEVVAHTIDYVCQTMHQCDNCPFSWLCAKGIEGRADGYDIADEFRRIAKEGKIK